jgi:capsular polysaccharide biosynthesis protein
MSPRNKHLEKLKIFAATTIPGAYRMWNGYSEFSNRTRIVAGRALRRLPGTSASFGPPRRVAATTEGWAKHAANSPNIASFRLLRSSSSLVRPFPKNGCAAFEAKFSAVKEAVTPPVFVAEIKNGRFVGRDHGAVIAADDTLLFDASCPRRNRGPERHDLLGRFRLPAMRKFSGRIANIVTPEAESNYYHWLVHLMPRLYWLKQAGFDPAHLDGIFLNYCKLPFQVACLQKFGIGLEKVIQTSASLHACVPNLIVCSYVNVGYNSDVSSSRAECLNAIRNLFRDGNPYIEAGRNYPEKIYISRQGAKYRRVNNSEDVSKILNRHGFVTVILEELPFLEQVALFSSARQIVGLNGAGLANIIFSSPGCKVLEIFRPDFIASYFWDLCASLGHEYYALVSNDTPLGETFFKFVQQANITVDCGMLDQVLSSW